MHVRIDDLVKKAMADWFAPMPCPICNGSGLGDHRYMWCFMCIGHGVITRRLWRRIIAYRETHGEV